MRGTLKTFMTTNIFFISYSKIVKKNKQKKNAVRNILKESRCPVLQWMSH